MPEAILTEISAGSKVFSKKYNKNVKVVKVNSDRTVEIEVRDIVDESDLSKKHKEEEKEGGY